MSYRPTQRINLEAEFGFLTEEETKGLDHQYRINWILFSGGSLDVVLNYRYEKTEIGSEAEEHAGDITARWIINRRMRFETVWSIFSENNGTRRVRQSLTAGLTARF